MHGSRAASSDGRFFDMGAAAAHARCTGGCCRRCGLSDYTALALCAPMPSGSKTNSAPACRQLRRMGGRRTVQGRPGGCMPTSSSARYLHGARRNVVAISRPRRLGLLRTGTRGASVPGAIYRIEREATVTPIAA